MSRSIIISWSFHGTPLGFRKVAVSLNKKLYDLGKRDEALQIWDQALKIDPKHLDTIYNRGLVLWRLARATDGPVLTQLSSLLSSTSDPQQVQTALALIHLERDDRESAASLLDKVTQRNPTQDNKTWLALAREKNAGMRMLSSINTWKTLDPRDKHYPDRWEIGELMLMRDGRSFFSVHNNGEIHVWDASTGQHKQVCQLRRRKNNPELRRRVFSPNGRLVLLLFIDGSLQLCEWQEGNVRVLAQSHAPSLVYGGPAPADGIHTFCLSPDAHLFCTGHLDGRIRLWERQKNAVRYLLEGHTEMIRELRFSPDQQQILSASYDKTLRLWEVATGRCLRVFQGHTGKVNAISVSADWHLALSVSDDGTLRLWEMATGRCIRVLEAHSLVAKSVVLSANGQFVLTGGEDLNPEKAGRDHTMRLWDIRNGRCLRTFWDKYDHFSYVDISADGRLGLSAGETTLLTWSLTFPHFRAPLRLSQIKPTAESAQIAQGANRLYREAETALARQDYARALQLVKQIRTLAGYERLPRTLEISTKLAHMYPRRGFYHVWLAHTFSQAGELVWSADMSADGRLVLTGGKPGLRLWETASGKCLRFIPTSATVRAVRVSADGRLGLVGDEAGMVALWNLEQGVCLSKHFDQSGLPPADLLDLSSDGRLAVVASSKGTGATVLDIESGRTTPIPALRAKNTVTKVLFSPDTQLVLLLYDKPPTEQKPLHMVLMSSEELCVFALANQKWTRFIFGLSVRGLCMSSDGLSFFTSRQDAIERYDIERIEKMKVKGTTVPGPEKPMLALNYTGGGITSLSLTADKRWLLSGHGDGSLRLWDLHAKRHVHTFDSQAKYVLYSRMSADGLLAMSLDNQSRVQIWRFDWEL